MMKFSWVAALILAGISVNGVAQQKNTFRVKPSHPEVKSPKLAAPIGKANPGSATGSGAAAKNLQSLERQSAKSAGPARVAGKKSAGATPGLKPIKDKPNPPISFNGNGGTKSAGVVNQGANPYKGRLRQKHSHQ